MVLDVKVDLSADRVGGIVERRLRVAPVVVEHEVDGEEPGSEDESLTNLATDEPGPLERHPGLFRQVRERDGIPSLLRVGRPQRGDGRSEEDRDEPGPERIPPAPS